MKRIVREGAVTLLLCAVTVAPALAQPMDGFGFGPGFQMMGPGFGYGPGMMGGMPGRGRHVMVDANDDGVVSAEEAASAADEMFTAMDSDDDGVLTKEEYLAVRMSPRFWFNPLYPAWRRKAKEERFAEMDADGDGKVAKDEFLAAAEAHHKAADADGDGTITPWEHRRRNWN
jgi:hypothetical protein